MSTDDNQHDQATPTFFGTASAGLHRFWERLYPADVIAVLVLTGAFFLLRQGDNTVASGVVIAITTYYFVRKTPRDYSKT